MTEQTPVASENLEPVREVWINDEVVAAKRRSIMRIMAMRILRLARQGAGSQGSECPAGVIPVMTQHYPML